MNAPDSFVPLTAAPPPAGPREFHVAILNGHDHGKAPEANPGFQSLESSHPPGQAAPGERKLQEPRVTVQRDGDRVTHLRIQCTCGQIMDLACVYEAPPQSAA